MLIHFPPIFRITLRENGSLIRQLAIPGWKREATVTEHPTKSNVYLIDQGAYFPIVHLIAGTRLPEPDWAYAIRSRRLGNNVTHLQTIDLVSEHWLKAEEIIHPPENLDAYEQITDQNLLSWKGCFNYKKEDVQNNIKGLRPPQIGALHGVTSHWTVHNDPATVVLPTGVGKTETMLSLLASERCQRVLVIVPTDALRSQITEKFYSFGILKEPDFGVIAQTASYPVVGTLIKKPLTIEQANSFFRKCNVIVTTMALASQCSAEVIKKMAQLTSTLFIDEAHHIAAPKWNELALAFEKSKVVQFTATPFRNDGKLVGGKRVFSFSLRQAQEQDYFKPITFKPVVEFDPTRSDLAVAEQAIEQLREDLHLGHILMARVGSITRAEEVFKIYQQYPEFEPVLVHSGISSKLVRDDAKRRLLTGQSRIVVCVDMLGEGFDLPELKIAAFHDTRKSLSITLQLAGRFTRSKPNLGTATFIANIANVEVKEDLDRLYQHDSDWNTLLPRYSEDALENEANLYEFLEGFQGLPKELTLKNVRPAMSTVVYRCKGDTWNPENFDKGIPGFDDLEKVYHTLNPHTNTLIVVTTKRVAVSWAYIDEIYNWDWQLYVIMWNPNDKLLFIHNSNNSGFYKKLAQAVCGDVEQITGPNVFRCLVNFGRLKLQNVGMLEQLGRLIRYTMRAGSDVETGMSEAQKRKAIKANLFGQGFESGHRSSIGCSYKGRFWSYKTTNLKALTEWCHNVGSKLIDETLDPEQVLNGTLKPRYVSARPQKYPITIEWPDLFYKEVENDFSIHFEEEIVPLHELSLELVNPSETGNLLFKVTSDSLAATYELQLFMDNDQPNFRIEEVGTTVTMLHHKRKIQTLIYLFENDPPVFWFSDGSSLSGNELVELPIKPEPYPVEKIEAWDWTGTSIKEESQRISRSATSIQFKVIDYLKSQNQTVVFDDDDSGESADVVAIRETATDLEVQFWHCKYSQQDKPGSRVKDLYEVCGQAQKSVRWLDNPRDLINHLLKREPRRVLGQTGTRFEIGTKTDLLRIRNKTSHQRIRLSIVIVQPGLSKTAVSTDQLELLAVTENYLKETYQVPFKVISS